jgi:hypothetical protein
VVNLRMVVCDSTGVTSDCCQCWCVSAVTIKCKKLIQKLVRRLHGHQKQSMLGGRYRRILLSRYCQHLA